MSVRQDRARYPLYRRFIVLLCVPLVFTFLCAATAAIWISYRMEETAREQQRQETVQTYAGALVKPLWDCDDSTSQGIVDMLSGLPNVSSVRLQDACNRREIVGTTSDESGPILGPYRQPIFYVDENGRSYEVGVMDIRFNHSSIIRTISEILWHYLGIFLAMLSVMLAGAALVFRHLVSVPLARFRAAIDNHIGVDRCGESLRTAAAERNDELGDVMRAYEKLMSELDTRFLRQETLARCAGTLLANGTGGEDASLDDLLEQVRLATQSGRVTLAENRTDGQDRLCLVRIAQSGGVPNREHPSWIGALEGRKAHWKERLSVRQPVIVDADALSESDRFILCGESPRSLVLLPVWGQSHWYGCLCVCHFADGQDWAEDAIFFLQTVADIIGASLENDRQLQRLADAVNKLRDNEKTLMWLARRDPLTGLGNRLTLEEELERAILRAQRNGQEGYVLLIDLNDFKQINDIYGHACGDLVLRVVAFRLKAAVRRTDIVTRYGGDEFVIIVESGPESLDTDSFRAKLVETVSLPQTHGGAIMTVGASIGFARFPTDGRSATELLAHADRAMYRDKNGARIPSLPSSPVDRG